VNLYHLTLYGVCVTRCLQGIHVCQFVQSAVLCNYLEVKCLVENYGAITVFEKAEDFD